MQESEVRYGTGGDKKNGSIQAWYYLPPTTIAYINRRLRPYLAFFFICTSHLACL